MGTTATNNLLRLNGTQLTIGNSDTNAFNIGAGKGSIVLDFSYPETELAVYGDYHSFGPATNLQTYIDDGRLAATNGSIQMITYDGTYSRIRQFKTTLIIIR